MSLDAEKLRRRIANLNAALEASNELLYSLSNPLSRRENCHRRTAYYALGSAVRFVRTAIRRMRSAESCLDKAMQSCDSETSASGSREPYQNVNSKSASPDQPNGT